MTINLKNFINYGLVGNKLSFPSKLYEIKRYTQEASILKNEINDASWETLLKEVQRAKSNIFVLSYIVFVKDEKTSNANFIDYVCKRIENEYDFFVLYRFASFVENKKKREFIFKELLNKDSFICILTEKELGDTLKSHKRTQILKNRHNIIEELKGKFYNGSIDITDVEKIKKYSIHPSELSYYLSYTIDPSLKEQIFSHYLDKYAINDIVFLIDKSFIQNIPIAISQKIEQKISAISDLEEITYLLIYKNKLVNKVLQKIFNEYFNNIMLKGFLPNTVDRIHIYLNPKYSTWIDNEDKINYIRYVAIYATILSKFYSLPIYVNNELIREEDFKGTFEQLKMPKFSVNKYDYNEDYRSSIVFAEADIPCAIHWSMSSNIAPSSATVAISGINVKNFMSLISIIA